MEAVPSVKPAREMLESIIPNLAALHDKTTFAIYTTYAVGEDKIRLVVHYQEPTGYPMVIEARAKSIDPDYVLRPSDVKIISWRKAD